ncbi:MAG: hypothetical protein PHU21_14525 [Elusimicrobia bacterium]|jgi:hypothetical protein|nr:hypothetical protein [Elusimicrobiota bacterium]
MKIFRRIIMFATGILALVNLVGVVLVVMTRNWGALPWALLRLAIWAGICVYLIRLDRRAAAPPPEAP